MERRRLLAGLGVAVPAALATAVAAGLRWGGSGRPPGTTAPGSAAGPGPSDDPAAPAPTPDAQGPAGPGPVGVDVGPAPDADVEVLAVVARDALGLAAARPGGVAQEPVRITVHHSAVVLEDARRAPAQLRAFQRDHQRRGWVDIAYHLAVDPAGNVYELRDPAVGGDSSTPYDTTGHLALLCLGDFDRQEPTAAQLEALARLVAAESATRGLQLDTLSAHRDHVLTWCPGAALYARMEEVASRAAALLGTGAPVLLPVGGAEGLARVAAIEDGTLGAER